jgi:hypothetical protein
VGGASSGAKIAIRMNKETSMTPKREAAFFKIFPDTLRNSSISTT